MNNSCCLDNQFRQISKAPGSISEAWNLPIPEANEHTLKLGILIALIGAATLPIFLSYCLSTACQAVFPSLPWLVYHNMYGPNGEIFILAGLFAGITIAKIRELGYRSWSVIKYMTN